MLRCGASLIRPRSFGAACLTISAARAYSPYPRRRSSAQLLQTSEDRGTRASALARRRALSWRRSAGPRAMHQGLARRPLYDAGLRCNGEPWCQGAQPPFHRDLTFLGDNRLRSDVHFSRRRRPRGAASRCSTFAHRHGPGAEQDNKVAASTRCPSAAVGEPPPCGRSTPPGPRRDRVSFSEKVANADYERVMRDVRGEGQHRHRGRIVRRSEAAAQGRKDYPKVSFLMGVGQTAGAQRSVFDNYIQEVGVPLTAWWRRHDRNGLRSAWSAARSRGSCTRGRG